MTIRAPAAAAAAEPGSQTKLKFITLVTTSQAAMEPAATPNTAVASPEHEIFQAIGAKQPRARGAKRFQDHRIIDPIAPASRQRAAQHQHRGHQGDEAGAADAERQIGDHLGDRLDRLLHRNSGHHGEGFRCGLQQRVFLLDVAAVRIGQVAMWVCGAPAKAPGE